MSFKPRPTGAAFFAARYYTSEGSSEYGIVLYPTSTNPDAYPHDWEFFFTREAWRKMGGHLPPKEGHVTVRLYIGDRT